MNKKITSTENTAFDRSSFLAAANIWRLLEPFRFSNPCGKKPLCRISSDREKMTKKMSRNIITMASESTISAFSCVSDVNDVPKHQSTGREQKLKRNRLSLKRQDARTATTVFILCMSHYGTGQGHFETSNH